MKIDEYSLHKHKLNIKIFTNFLTDLETHVQAVK